jgi:hypothetical protein
MHNAQRNIKQICTAFGAVVLKHPQHSSQHGVAPSWKMTHNVLERVQGKFAEISVHVHGHAHQQLQQVCFGGTRRETTRNSNETSAEQVQVPLALGRLPFGGLARQLNKKSEQKINKSPTAYLVAARDGGGKNKQRVWAAD